MLVTFSTADMLVPIDQVDAKLVRPADPTRFPAGFKTAMSDRFPGVAGKRTLLEVLPPSRREVFLRSLRGSAAELSRAGAPQARPTPLKLPFSTERNWSLVVIDEGPVEPAIGHFKYAWNLDGETFRTWAEERGVAADQLTGPKLERMMLRLSGRPWRPLRVRPAGVDGEIDANVLDYPEAERSDVVRGLAAFAADDERAERLGRLYQRLPSRLKQLGPRLGDGTPGGVRAALADAGR
jgi:hypothetical protein